MRIRQTKQRVTGLAATDLHFAFDQSGILKSLNRHLLRFRVSGKKFRGVTFLVCVSRRSQKHARAFIFQFRRREDALAHRLLAQARVKRVGILSFDKSAEALRHRRRACLPFGKRRSFCWF